MIIRDESAGLERCLASIAPVVDEVVVVDTGSTDDSVEIARRLGARVHCETWRDDFSFHRNRALELARGDWALVIDGDEVMARAGELRATVDAAHDDPEVDGVTVWVDATTGGQVVEQFVAVRAFRRGRCHYEYPVHNQLRGVRVVRPSRARITARYDGALHRKAQRSLPLLERMLADDPASVHAKFFLAKTWFSLCDAERCLGYCVQLAEHPPADRAFASMWVWAACCAMHLGDLDAAERWIERGLAAHPRFVDLRHCQLALVAARWNEALGHLHEYVTASLTSVRHHGNLAAAARLLGLPLDFGDGDGLGTWGPRPGPGDHETLTIRERTRP